MQYLFLSRKLGNASCDVHPHHHAISAVPMLLWLISTYTTNIDKDTGVSKRYFSGPMLGPLEWQLFVAVWLVGEVLVTWFPLFVHVITTSVVLSHTEPTLRFNYCLLVPFCCQIWSSRLWASFFKDCWYLTVQLETHLIAKFITMSDSFCHLSSQATMSFPTLVPWTASWGFSTQSDFIQELSLHIPTFLPDTLVLNHAKYSSPFVSYLSYFKSSSFLYHSGYFYTGLFWYTTPPSSYSSARYCNWEPRAFALGLNCLVTVWSRVIALDLKSTHWTT